MSDKHGALWKKSLVNLRCFSISDLMLTKMKLVTRKKFCIDLTFSFIEKQVMNWKGRKF